MQVGLYLQEVRHEGGRQLQAVETFPVALSRPQGLELEQRTAAILGKTSSLPSWVAWDACVQLSLKNCSSLFGWVGHSGQECWSPSFLEISLCK